MTFGYIALRNRLRLDADNPPGGGNGNPPVTPPATPPPGDEDDDDEDLETADTAKLREALRKQRQIAKDARRTATTLQTEKERRDAADRDAQAARERESGDFKAVADREAAARVAAEKALQEERDARMLDQVMTAITVESSGLFFHKPGEAHKFIDLTKVERDDTGRPKNVKKLVEDLAKAEPWLVKGQRTPGLPETPEGQGQATTTSVVKSYIEQRYGKQKAS